MEQTTITLHSDFQIARVDPRIFSGFLEHMGRAVYQGVYDPDCAYADNDGFRTDVVKALRRWQMPVIRYPGGNFASGYHWMDGVGPREQRPISRESAWNSTEPNTFGTDEFIKLCRKMNWAPMLTVNLGTGTPEEARNWVEYCNSPSGTRYADVRVANGSKDPHAVKLWCLGNEMDGPWQLGYLPADQYAIRAQQAAKLMKDVDKSVELVVGGTSSPAPPTYLEWDRLVLEYVGDLADYISVHRYVGKPSGDTPDFLAVTNAIDEQIEQTDAVCRFVYGKRRGNKRVYICFDEWNVWYKDRRMDGEGKFAPHLSEEIYNLEDALVVAGFLNSFIRHADAVKIANIAQIVNTISPMQTRGNELLLQSTYYVFEMFAKRRQRIALKSVVRGPSYEGKTNGRVHYIDTSAIIDHNLLHVFVTNRSLDEAAIVEINLADRPIAAFANAEVLTGPGVAAANSFEKPKVICPEPFNEVRIARNCAIAELPPLSVTAMTFDLE